MGCFDTLEAECPGCKAVRRIQTKRLGCNLHTYWVGDPVQIAPGDAEPYQEPIEDYKDNYQTVVPGCTLCGCEFEASFMIALRPCYVFSGFKKKA